MRLSLTDRPLSPAGQLGGSCFSTKRAFSMPQRPTISNVGRPRDEHGGDGCEHPPEQPVQCSSRGGDLATGSVDVSSGAPAPMQPRSASSDDRTSTSGNMAVAWATAPPSLSARRHSLIHSSNRRINRWRAHHEGALVLVGIMLTNVAAAEETMKDHHHPERELEDRHPAGRRWGTIERQIERRPGYTRVEQRSGNSRTTVVQSSDPAMPRRSPSVAPISGSGLLRTSGTGCRGRLPAAVQYPRSDFPRPHCLLPRGDRSRDVGGGTLQGSAVEQPPTDETGLAGR